MSDPVEDRAVLDVLKDRSGRIPVAPVPAELIDTVRRLAAGVGYRARVVEAREFVGRDRASEPTRATMPSQPLIVALPMVGDPLVALAELLAGRPAIRDVARDPRLQREGETALVLLDRDSPADAARHALASLGEHRIPFAVVPTDRGPAGRLPLLKALLFPSVNLVHIDRGDALLSRPAGKAGPKPGILTVSGHGNAIDLGGRGIVVCPRHRAAEGRMGGLYPCFGDGRCFRQPLFGRRPDSSTGLIDPARFQHSLVLLLGCATFALGNAPFARRGTILWRMAESSALAAVATVGVFYHNANVETALLALLLEGHALGDAVRIFNAWHRDAYGPTSPAGEAFGPLVAVGNPAFRFNGRAGPRATLARAGLAIVKLDRETEGMLLSVHPGAAGAGVRVVGARADESMSAYVSVRSPDGSDREPPFELLPFDRQACLSDRNVLRNSLPHLAMWRLLLGDPACPMAGALGEQGGRIVADVDVHGVERLLREYLATNAFGSGAVLPTRATLAAHRHVMARWQNCQTSMLEAASLYNSRTGGFLFHLWQQFYERGGGSAMAQACPSCGEQTRYLSYHGPSEPADCYHVVHCPACGVLGQLPSGVAVRADGPLDIRGGETLMLGVEVTAGRSGPLRGEFMLVREDWFHTVEDVATSGLITIESGAQRTIPLALPVVWGLAPGLYPLTLLGVVNGALVQIRRHVSILEPLR
ncbi:MAG: hypothetical protein V4459_09445 [Pseudomonadota bacterium]